MKRKSLKVTPVKGRPMLHWVGKKPLDVVQHFPAQLCETVGVENPPAEPSYKEFAKSSHNLVFHGDNKEILSSLLIAGFRGKVDLIYIDPPFDSGADYVRQVKLRGQNEKLEGQGHTAIEQDQYADIWANDNYLQFMYERLILMRELLSDKGSIYLHCDWHKSHHLRFLLDEIFGAENFTNEIIWHYRRWVAGSNSFQKMHDSIFYYSKSEGTLFNKTYVEPTAIQKKKHEKGWDRNTAFIDGRRQPQLLVYNQEKVENAIRSGRIRLTDYARRVEVNTNDTLAPDVWQINFINSQSEESASFPTQKPEALIDRIIKASSNEDSIVLDCFCGSGTTAAVAEKLGRRWIMADLNKGAIQTTIKRLQGVIKEKNGDLAEKNGHGLIHYRVNNYDFAKQNGLKKIIISKYGIETDRKDLFFDGTVGGQLAKIIDLDKPLTKLDIQIIKDELQQNRPDEQRNITVFCNGSEIELIADLEKEKNPINKITVRDIQQDGMITNQPAQAEVKITKKAKKVKIGIDHYISPSILARMDIDRTLFDEQIDDFRAQIDCVLIDTDYNGKSFNIVESDLPQKKTDFVKGQYELVLPRTNAKIAVKIVDMLGEETVIAK